MKSKNTILIIIVLLVCGALYWFMLQKDEGRHAKTELQPFAALESPAWQRLEFSAPGKQPVTLVRKDGHWQVDGLPDCKVKKVMVSKILDALKNLKLDSLVTSGKEKFAVYQVDELKGIKVHGVTDGGPVGLVVGKVAADFMHTYVRLEKDRRVFRINGLFGHLFAHDPADFCQQEDEAKKGGSGGGKNQPEAKTKKGAEKSITKQ